MTASQPLVTPEELQCLLGWPQSAAQAEGAPRAAPAAGTCAPLRLNPTQPPAGMAMAG